MQASTQFASRPQVSTAGSHYGPRNPQTQYSAPSFFSPSSLPAGYTQAYPGGPIQSSYQPTQGAYQPSQGAYQTNQTTTYQTSQGNYQSSPQAYMQSQAAAYQPTPTSYLGAQSTTYGGQSYPTSAAASQHYHQYPVQYTADSSQRYVPGGCQPVATFPHGISTIYSTGLVPAFMAAPEETKAAVKPLEIMSEYSSEDDYSENGLESSEAEVSKLPAKKEKTIEQRFQKKTQLEHILLRPDTYVGSLEQETCVAWVWDDANDRMVNRQITYVPAMFKIFDEILVNAADVKARELHERASGNKDYKAQKMTRIDVEIDQENSCITVSNDGSGIPVEIHKEHKVYVPELIFGHLLTSDNYDDSDQRVTGGRNGFGAKLTNIFSESFSVEVIDSKRKRKFQMTWRSNMTSHTDPKIVDTPLKTDSVKISFRPDLTRFRSDGLDADLVALMQKRAFDIAGTTGVKVSLNGKRLPVKDFKSYVDLYFAKPNLVTKIEDEDVADMVDGSRSESEFSLISTTNKSAATKTATSTGTEGNGVFKIHEKINDRWEIIISQSDGQFQQVSFVNSIATSKGGTHVNYVIEPLVSAIMKRVTSKNKGGIEIKGHHVKNHLFLFVNCLIVNPTFDSQTKETMTLKASQFGSVCQVSDKTINSVLKSPITEAVLLWAQTKQQVDLKRKMKSGGGRREKILGIPKLEDANDAGGRNSERCTLILTEGDSAKTSCLAGLSVVGRDRFGVFPLRGKLLNVRDASFKQLTENKEIQHILTITGLEVGKKLVDPKSLRYGSIMIMTDQDHDGSHIKGLLINLLQHYWPDLLRHNGFLKEFVTPIVKASRKKGEELAFYTIPEYEAWKRLNNNGKGWRVKYYKGLGTSDSKEFKEYFSQLDRHQLTFDYEDEQDFEAIDLAFNSKRSEDRKNWIQSFQEGTFLDHRDKTVTYKDFVNKELVLFSRYDTERSIPCLMDGWKPGQRKVLWSVFKKNLVKSEMKVAQLASYVADVSCYHHGEDSLAGTIVNMAQNFVGSNNLNVLEPCGQFGSRKEGGKDASATRYIYTKLSITARSLFVTADDELLHYLNEEGRVIEPKWFVPVIPLVLVNGAEGIGTGWSCSLPNYNPRDIIANVRAFIRNEPLVPMIPWYRGFRGRIERQEKGKGFDAVGLIERLDEETLFISELPAKQWTQPYKDFLEDWLQYSVDEEDAASRSRPAPKRAAAPKVKAKAKAGVRGRPGETSTKTYKVLIKDFKDNSSHESIAFTIRMDSEQMAIAEAEGLEKTFRLRKSIPTTNMTLFTSEGIVKRFETELDILREFAIVRLDYYVRRKRHALNVLEKDKCIASNKLKFIVAIIENDLVIHKRKKAELVADLRQRGFDTIKRINERFNTTNPTMQGDILDDGIIREPSEEEAAAKSEQESANDYDYLVGMPLWSLTYERVKEFEKEVQLKEQQLEHYRNKTPEELWESDLTALEASIDQYERLLAEQCAHDGEFRRRASLKATAKRQPVSRVKKEAVMAPRPKITTSKPPKKPSENEASATGPGVSLMERLRQKMTQPGPTPTQPQSTLDSLLDKLALDSAAMAARPKRNADSGAKAIPSKRLKGSNGAFVSSSDDENMEPLPPVKTRGKKTAKIQVSEDDEDDEAFLDDEDNDDSFSDPMSD